MNPEQWKGILWLADLQNGFEVRAPQLWIYFTHRISSGVIEAVNHKIKVTQGAAYGYRNFRYFQLKILQRCGFLNSQFAPLSRINKFQAKTA